MAAEKDGTAFSDILLSTAGNVGNGVKVTKVIEEAIKIATGIARNQKSELVVHIIVIFFTLSTFFG